MAGRIGFNRQKRGSVAMKRTISVLLIMAFCLCLSSCGGTIDTDAQAISSENTLWTDGTRTERWTFDDFMMWSEDQERFTPADQMWILASDIEKENNVKIRTYRDVCIGDSIVKVAKEYDLSKFDLYIDTSAATELNDSEFQTEYLSRHPSMQEALSHTDELEDKVYLMAILWAYHNPENWAITPLLGDGEGGVDLMVDGIDISKDNSIFSICFALNNKKVADILYYGQIAESNDNSNITTEPQEDSENVFSESTANPTDTSESEVEENTDPESESSSNFLMNLLVEKYKMSNGSRGQIVVTKTILSDLVSEEEFIEFVDSRVKDSRYNWFTIDFMDGTGLVFAGSDTTVINYGEIDPSDGSLLKQIQTYVRSDNTYNIVE